METIIVFVLGFLAGMCVLKMVQFITYVKGTISVDLKSGLCGFRVEQKDLLNPQKKYAILDIDRNADLSDQLSKFDDSRDEQSI